MGGFTWSLAGDILRVFILAYSIVSQPKYWRCQNPESGIMEFWFSASDLDKPQTLVYVEI